MNAPLTNDWAWPKLIESLQRDIARIQELVEAMRIESAEAREAHRQELSRLIEQLRTVKDQLEPIISERAEAAKAKREMVWGWIGKGGWIVLTGVALACWHYLTKHLGEH